MSQVTLTCTSQCAIVPASSRISHTAHSQVTREAGTVQCEALQAPEGERAVVRCHRRELGDCGAHVHTRHTSGVATVNHCTDYTDFYTNNSLLVHSLFSTFEV